MAVFLGTEENIEAGDQQEDNKEEDQGVLGRGDDGVSREAVLWIS
jgi:hypothetical protein